MIEFIRTGRMNSVQDLGRSGFRHLGVCQSGALDQTALAIANRLVGNPPEAAGIEFTFGPCILRFSSDTRIAFGGADFSATLGDRPLSPWWSVPVYAGQIVTLNAPRHGMRTYLAVTGGINVPIQLGARATDLQAGFGGHAGRALLEGDRLAIGTPNPNGAIVWAMESFGVRAPSWYYADDEEPIPIRVIPGPEYALFTATAQKAFWNNNWILTPHSNRMGFRLAGTELKMKRNSDLLSYGVLPGVIQVPPAGQPIVLMADAQTTGGYPKIGVVIHADLSKLAQLRLHRTLRFVECDIAQAREELNEEVRYLEQIDQAIHWLRPAKKSAHA